MKLDFAIIGAQKAGSTYLRDNLKEHPDIYIPNGEVPFFEDPDYHENTQLEDYFKKGNIDDKLIGIKRPNYLGKNEVPHRLYEHNSNIKLIIFLRNPVERAFSAYYHGMRMGFLPIKEHEDALLKIAKGDGDFYKKYPSTIELINFGYYHLHLMKYLKYFTRDQLYIGYVEDFKNSPLITIQNIYKFLGVENGFIPQSLNSKPMASIYSSKRLKFRQFINKKTSYYSYYDDNTRIHKKNGYIYSIITKIFAAFDRFFIAKIIKNKKPEIDNKVKEELIKVYRKDIENLQKLTNRDLTHWLK